MPGRYRTPLRTAVSTFRGFLKANWGIELRLPKIRRELCRRSQGVGKADRRLNEPPPFNADRTAKDWVPLALRYFHHLSAADAKTVCAGSSAQPRAEGTVLSFQGQESWIPAEPMTLGLSHRS